MKNLHAQFDTMLQQGRIPVLEYKVTLPDGEQDYMLFEISAHPDGFVFSVDPDYKTWFSGNIIQLSEINYLIPFDENNQDLDYYFEQINLEITEGYLIPNNIDFE